MGVSRRKYAAMRGVSESAVRKAISTGRISVEADNTIDPARADREWSAQTDPAQRREVGDDGQIEGSAYQRAKTENEILKARMAEVRLAKLKGELVDRAKAEAAIFDLARQERDAWLHWPARVAAIMAADLGVDARKMEDVLGKYLRAQMGDLDEVKPRLR